jgi:predicted acetyltransferase
VKMRRIEIAIRNIFKEQGYTVKSITENTVTVDRFKEVTYNYTVQDDLIIITNKIGVTVYEKSIRSYQDLNISVTID